MPTIDEGKWSKFTWANMDPYEANWIIDLDLALDTSLHFDYSTLWAPLWFLFLLVRINLAFFYLGPSSKAQWV